MIPNVHTDSRPGPGRAQHRKSAAATRAICFNFMRNGHFRVTIIFASHENIDKWPSGGGWCGIWTWSNGDSVDCVYNLFCCNREYVFRQYIYDLFNSMSNLWPHKMPIKTDQVNYYYDHYLNSNNCSWWFMLASVDRHSTEQCLCLYYYVLSSPRVVVECKRLSRSSCPFPAQIKPETFDGWGVSNKDIPDYETRCNSLAWKGNRN